MNSIIGLKTRGVMVHNICNLLLSPMNPSFILKNVLDMSINTVCLVDKNTHDMEGGKEYKITTSNSMVDSDKTGTKSHSSLLLRLWTLPSTSHLQINHFVQLNH